MKALLVLEDEPCVKDVLHQILDQYTLLEVTTAEQALELFTSHGRKIDLLVADVTLPTSSGIHVALLLRSSLSGLPVILTSGYPLTYWSDRDAADLKRLGSISVRILDKPFLAQAFSETVAGLIGRRMPAPAR